jgi:hypothetical protein
MWIISALFGLGRIVGGLFTGGSLDSILKTIDRNLDNEVQKETVKAEVTKKWIDRQADLLVGRTWWFQLFFVIPLGVWWTAVILDSIFGWERQIAALPNPLDEWAAWIISALFIVDGTKAVLGRFGK